MNNITVIASLMRFYRQGKSVLSTAQLSKLVSIGYIEQYKSEYALTDEGVAVINGYATQPKPVMRDIVSYRSH